MPYYLNMLTRIHFHFGTVQCVSIPPSNSQFLAMPRTSEVLGHGANIGYVSEDAANVGSIGSFEDLFIFIHVALETSFMLA